MIKGTDKEFTAKVVNGKAVFDLPKFKQGRHLHPSGRLLGSDLLTKADKTGRYQRHR